MGHARLGVLGVMGQRSYEASFPIRNTINQPWTYGVRERVLRWGGKDEGWQRRQMESHH